MVRNNEISFLIGILIAIISILIALIAPAIVVRIRAPVDFKKSEQAFQKEQVVMEIKNVPSDVRCFRLMWTNGTQVVAAEGISCFPK